MPVPPIFQPELPARAIAYLADHPRRNMWVGAPRSDDTDRGARGSFNEKSHDKDPVLWMSLHRRELVGGLAAAGALCAAALRVGRG